MAWDEEVKDVESSLDTANLENRWDRYNDSKLQNFFETFRTVASWFNQSGEVCEFLLEVSISIP